MVDEAQRQRTTFPDVRESYIRETRDFNSPTNFINRELQKFNNLQRAYEGTRILPQRFPDWVPHDLMNPFQSFTDLPVGGKSWLGSPMWLDAKNKTYGLPGTEVAQSKWKEKFQSIIDMIMNRESLDEKDAKKYIFDNYGLAV